jgi:hypothetical protein
MRLRIPVFLLLTAGAIATGRSAMATGEFFVTNSDSNAVIV